MRRRRGARQHAAEPDDPISRVRDDALVEVPRDASVRARSRPNTI